MTSNRSIIDEFSSMINQCRSKVTFVTEEGDRLVANSMLSALVGLATFLSVAEAIDFQVECEDPADCERISQFMKKYHLGQHRNES